MKIEELSPDQMVQMVLLGLIILSLFALGVASFVYWMHRIATNQKFSIAKGPLATVGFIDCLQAVAIVIVLIFGAQYVAFKVDPSLIPAEPDPAEVSPAKDASDPVPSEDSLPSSSRQAVDKPFGEMVLVSARSNRSDLGNAQNTILSDPVSEALEVTKSDETGALEGGAPSDSSGGMQADRDADSLQGDDVEKWGEEAKKISAGTVVISAVAATMQLLAVFLVYWFIRVRTGCRPEQLGLNWKNALSDIGIGLWVLFLTIPVLMILSGLLSGYTGVKYEHPVIDMMKQHPWLAGLVAWMAVIVAPISEEFFFRTMLIGFFESIHFGRGSKSFFLGWMPKSATEQNPSPFRQSLHQTAPVNSDFVESSSTGYVPPWWPAILSGVLFGIAHFSYGVSWIPLILFGIVLGRVYQLRRSLITCITIHLVFNGINLLNLWLSLGLPR